MTTTVRLNPEQEEIRGVARSFLQARFPSDKVRALLATDTGFEEDVWKEIADLGWLSIAIPEDRGGAGYTLVERCLLLEEMGRVLYGGPFLSSAVLAADALLLAAEPKLGDELLAAVADGSTRATLVAAGDLLSSADPAAGFTATEVGNGWQVSGEAGMVLDGMSAQLLLVVARIEGGGLGLFSVEPDGGAVTREPAPTIDETRKTARVRLDGAAGRRIDGGADTEQVIRQVLDRGAISLAAESAGGTRQAIEMTVAYMHEREQFGGPIGRFQALKHRLADLHVHADAAREGVYSAADATLGEGGRGAEMAAAGAKSATAGCYELTTAEAVQLHGGIGFTEEHDIGLYYKRALVSVPTLGVPSVQRERIVEALGV